MEFKEKVKKFWKTPGGHQKVKRLHAERGYRHFILDSVPELASGKTMVGFLLDIGLWRVFINKRSNFFMNISLKGKKHIFMESYRTFLEESHPLSTIKARQKRISANS